MFSKSIVLFMLIFIGVTSRRSSQFYFRQVVRFLKLLWISLSAKYTGAPNGNFRENICSEDDLRTRIFGTFVVKFLACLPLLGFSDIYKMV